MLIRAKIVQNKIKAKINNLRLIGTDVSDTTALAEDVLAGKTFYGSNAQQVVGVLPLQSATANEDDVLVDVTFMAGDTTLKIGTLDLAASAEEQDVLGGKTFFANSKLIKTGTGQFVNPINADATPDKVIKGNTFYAGDISLKVGTLDYSLPVEEKDINFYAPNKENLGQLDRIASFYLSDLPLASLPTPPDHSNGDVPLTFQEWNWSLEEINELNDKLDIGAVYYPSDDKTHLFFNCSTKSPRYFNQTLRLTFGATGGTIDWGDGQTETVGSGNRTLTHNYYAETDTIFEAQITAESLGFQANTFNVTVNDYNNTIEGVIIANHLSIISGSGMNYCFKNCSNLKFVLFSNSISNLIGNECFRNCLNLVYFIFPSSFRITPSSNSYIFAGCATLKKCIFSKIEKRILGYMFSGTAQIEFTFNKNIETVEAYSFGSKTTLYDLIIPESVNLIGSYSFGSNYSLNSVTFNGSPKINANAFNSCKINTIYFETQNPPILDNANAFSSSRTGIHGFKIFVPEGSLEAYQRATNWSAFAEFMEEYEL